MTEQIIAGDPYFRVEVLASTPNPQTVIWKAMHQDYSENFVADENFPSESKAGETAVKRLLAGERGHYGCYSDDTEVLTDQGWIKWPLVNKTMKLAAVEINTWKVNFEHPISIQKIEFSPNDHFYELNSQRLNFAVTFDHRMIVSTRKKDGTWTSSRILTAEKVIGTAVRYRLAGILEERKIPDDVPQDVDLVNLFKLAGFFYGDGCRSKSINPASLRFHLKRIRKILFLKNCNFLIKERNNNFIIQDKKVATWIHKHFTGSDCKVIPTFIMQLPMGLFNAFAEGLKNSDGTIKRNSWCFDSVYKESLDILQAAFHLNGQAASFSLNNKNEGAKHKNHKPCWRLHVSSREPWARAEVSQKGRTKGEEKLIPYNGIVYCASVSTGALIVRRNNKPVILGNCLEHPQITFNAGWFPHSVMQQGRTHRISTWDCQSSRYTGQRIIDVIEGKRSVEEVFYARPIGFYTDRKGKRYEYTEDARMADLEECVKAARMYADKINMGYSEEHARSMIPFDIRQHFVVSFNLRSLLHFLDLRAKLDAQFEIRQLCELMVPKVTIWVPEIATWYTKTRLYKGRLAP